MNQAFCILFLALSASAHEGYPIRPVEARFNVERDRIVADIESDSIFWIEEVAHLHPMPPVNWPADALDRVQAYVNAHLRVSLDGRVLPGTLVSARYRQQPWEVNEEGTFILRLTYPPASDGGALTIASTFFEEYRKEMAAEYGGRPLPYAADYRTVVSVPGKTTTHAVLTPDSPSLTLPVANARRGTFAMALEGLLVGARAALSSASGFPAVLAIALCLGGLAPRRALLAGLAAAAATGFAAGAGLTPPPWQIWATTLGTALVAGRWRHAPSFCAWAACSLGLAWCAAARLLLPHSALALPAALLGALTAGGALLAAAWFVLHAERRRMSELSESRVEELFARRVRLTATALAMVGAYGLWQSFQR